MIRLPKGVTQKANGEFAIQTMVGGKRMNATADTVEEASILKVQMKVGIYNAPAPVTAISITDAVKAYIKRRVERSTSDNTTPQQLKWYHNKITAFFGTDTKLVSITPAKIHLFQDELLDRDMANTTVNTLGSILYQSMNDAYNRGQMANKPTRMDHLRAENGRIRFFDVDEEQRICAWFLINDFREYKDLTEFFIETGMRRIEVANLKWCDIDLTTKRITIWKPKNNFPRTINMTPMAHDILESWKAKRHNITRFDDKIFGSINWTNFGRVWRSMRAGLGQADDKDMVMHALRHTCCTRLVSAGTDLRTVMEWMGHASLDITQRYSHFVPQRMDEAVGRLVTLRGN